MKILELFSFLHLLSFLVKVFCENLSALQHFPAQLGRLLFIPVIHLVSAAPLKAISQDDSHPLFLFSSHLLIHPFASLASVPEKSAPHTCLRSALFLAHPSSDFSPERSGEQLQE